MKKYLKWLQGLGILLFIYILVTLDTAKIFSSLESFEWKWLFAYGILAFVSLSLKVVRWFLILKNQRINYRLSSVFSIISITSFWGVVTPGRIGEFGKILFLKKDDHDLSKGLVSVVIDRLYDLLMLFIMGIVSFVVLVDVFVQSLNSLLLILMIISISITLLYLLRNHLWLFVKYIVKIILPQDKYEVVISKISSFQEEFKSVSSKSIPMLFLISILVYVLYYLQIYVVGMGFGIEVPFIYLVLCYSLSALVSLLPVTIGGIGTREAIFIFLLAKVFVPPEKAVLIGFFDGTVFGLIFSALFALVAYLLKVKDQK